MPKKVCKFKTIDYLCCPKCFLPQGTKLSERIVLSGGYQSGQMGQTVNLLAYAFGGSNPSPPTVIFIGKPLGGVCSDFGSPRANLFAGGSGVKSEGSTQLNDKNQCKGPVGRRWITARQRRNPLCHN